MALHGAGVHKKVKLCLTLYYYSLFALQDLLRVLSDLLDRKMDYDEERNFLGSHESLLCIHTVLSILSGQGEALTLDPQKFYRHLDRIIAELKVSEVFANSILLTEKSDLK